MKQYHFNICLESYARDWLVIFAEDAEDAWKQAVSYCKAHHPYPEQAIRQLSREEYAPEVYEAHRIIRFQYYE